MSGVLYDPLKDYFSMVKKKFAIENKNTAKNNAGMMTPKAIWNSGSVAITGTRASTIQKAVMAPKKMGKRKPEGELGGSNLILGG